MTYREIELGDSAMTYLQKCLEQGNSLSARAQTCLSFVKGRVVTLLPENVPRDMPLDDSAGVTGHCDERDSWIEKKVSLFLQSGQDHLVVLEDACARRRDPVVGRLGRRVRFLGDEVYVVLENRDSDPKVVSNVMSRTRGYLQLGFMVTHADCAELQAGSPEWTHDTIAYLAENTEKILAGAYDGEGYLMWTRCRE